MSDAKQTGRDAHPLDHLVWNALVGKQKHLAVGDARVLRYPSEVGRFAAMVDTSPESFDTLRATVAEVGPLALVTSQTFDVPAGFSIVRRAVLLQMIWQGTPFGPADLPHVALGTSDVPDMLALTAATEPGPFGPRTIELGGYIGVRNEGKLAAMAGERIRLEGFAEISAVCVDPAFRGRGYAGGLMKVLIANITARGETPFLHVFTTNEGAIALYRALGFVVRHEMCLTVLDRA